MPQKIEDMIVPERKRSIRDIPIPAGRRRSEVFAPEIRRSDVVPSRENTEYSNPSRKRLWLAIVGAVLLLTFATLSLFNGSTLAYIPKSASVVFDKDIFTARKTGDDNLLFSVIKFSKDKGRDVAASGDQEAQRKASGTIIVYNASSKLQKFRATTRFATPDGKTYQVKDAISIPAKKLVSGVEKLGTLEVTVYAEFPGAESNIGLNDFTLPGLKGTTLFSSIYARSKTAMTGGFVGVEKIVNKEEETQAKTELETALKDELISEAQAQVPEDFILIPSLSAVTFDDLEQSGSENKDSVTINKRGNLQGVMFKRSDLTTNLAQKKITLASGELVDFSDLNLLNFAFADGVANDLSLLDTTKFSVTGETIAVWRTDEVALKADLVGKHKKDLYSVLQNYPTVVSATATIRPFWKNYFPSDGAKITMKKLPVK